MTTSCHLLPRRYPKQTSSFLLSLVTTLATYFTLQIEEKHEKVHAIILCLTNPLRMAWSEPHITIKSFFTSWRPEQTRRGTTCMHWKSLLLDSLHLPSLLFVFKPSVSGFQLRTVIQRDGSKAALVNFTAGEHRLLFVASKWGGGERKGVP